MLRCGYCRIASVMLPNQSERFLSLAFGHVSRHSFLDKIRARSNAIISYSMFHAYIHLSPWYDPTVFDMLLM